jgi:hypothetical protein
MSRSLIFKCRLNIDNSNVVRIQMTAWFTINDTTIDGAT